MTMNPTQIVDEAMNLITACIYKDSGMIKHVLEGHETIDRERIMIAAISVIVAFMEQQFDQEDGTTQAWQDWRLKHHS